VSRHIRFEQTSPAIDSTPYLPLPLSTSFNHFNQCSTWNIGQGKLEVVEEVWGCGGRRRLREVEEVEGG